MALEGTQISHYQIIRLIGSGGMGEVYLARDTRIARQVAIKVVRNEAMAYPQAEETKNTLRLFEREMKTIALLDHPNILPLYDFGEATIAQGLLAYMVMPFRPEGSLLNWLDRYHKDRLLPSQELLFLLQQAASALQHAHNAHVIHLDVKPSNFLIRQREHASDHPDLLLTDFGISRFNTATATASQSIRGTPMYMAPEQWTSSPVPATDQYALAVMVYQLLTGSLPFQGNMQQVMYQHLQVRPKPPSTLNPHLPEAANEVILRALAKQPADRFASIALFADVLALAWPQTSTLPGHSGDPEALVLTERILPKTETPPPLPPTVRTSSTSDPNFPAVVHYAASQAEAPGISSTDVEPSFRLVPSPTNSITPVPPAPHKSTRNPWLPVVIGLLLLLAFISISVSVLAYLSHTSAPASTPTTSILTPAGTPTSAPTLTPTTPPTFTPASSYPQLKPFYSGTATGYADATITFALQSEDQHGNVRMQTTFQRTDNQASAIYHCQGQVSQDSQLTLSCTEVGISTFHLSIHGTIFADGHMEGTEEATNSNDPTYDHIYNWSVS